MMESGERIDSSCSVFWKVFPASGGSQKAQLVCLALSHA